MNQAKKILDSVRLEQFTEDELQRIYDSLNQWEWPELLGNEPDCWAAMQDYEHAGFRCFWPLKKVTKDLAMEKIFRRIFNILGEEKTLRWHWIHNLERTDEQFNQWYLQNREPSLESSVIMCKWLISGSVICIIVNIMLLAIKFL